MHFNSVDIDWGYLLDRLEHMLDLGEEFLTRKLSEYQFDPGLFASLLVFRWHQEDDAGVLRLVVHPDLPDLGSLLGIDPALQRLRQNTLQFLHGAPANHVLLWGARGSGKSSAVKGLLGEFGEAGLRLVAIRREDLSRLPAICAQLRPQPYRFILFCDGLNLDGPESDYRELSALLDGGLEARPDNVLVYATCNHLQPYPADDANEAYPEQCPLADCFGITLGFPATSEQTYLAVVQQLADQRQLPVSPEVLTAEARQWAARRRTRSGRTARQFIDDLAGRLQLSTPDTN